MSSDKQIIHPALLLHGLSFSVVDTWEEVLQWWAECPEYQEFITRLDEPSGLDKIELVKRHFMFPHLDVRFKLLDFSGTTVRQAIKKILKFYTHKTIRREIGDHTFFEGIEEYPDIPRHPRLHLSS